MLSAIIGFYRSGFVAGKRTFDPKLVNSVSVESITKILSIAIGGAFGAVARYLINISPLARMFEHFPFPTLFINVSGSFLIGFLLILLTDKIPVSDNFRMMVIVGFLGAFTTFSTFEMEIYSLLRDKLYFTGGLYLLLSVAVGFIGVIAGVAAARHVP
jgi:fluoride exporter